MRLLTILIACLVTSFSYSQNLQISTSDSSFCYGDTVVLEATNGYSHYEWNTRDTNRVIFITTGGWYEVEAQNSSGTSFYDSIYIQMFTPLSLTYGTNPSPPYLCEGDSIIIELSDGFTNYWWNTGHSGDRNVLYPTEDKTIVIEAVDSNGCESRLEFTIYVDDCDTSCDDLIEAWPSQYFCGDDSVNLEAPNGYYSYSWSDGSNDRVRWVDEEGWYILTVVDSNNHTCVDSIYIEEYSPTLEYGIEPDEDTYCVGDSILIELSNNFESYWWSTGDDDRIIETVVTTTGRYVVEAEDSNGCEARLVIELNVIECDSTCDDLIEVWPDNTLQCGVDSINLEGRSGFDSYQWTDNVGGRIRWVDESGWYTLIAIDSNSHTCVDSVFIEYDSVGHLSVYTNPSSREICEGDSIVIEVSDDFEEYGWNIGNYEHRAVYYPNETTTVVIEAVDSNGCEYRASFVVYVVDCDEDSCDNLIGIWPDNDVCDGDSINLEAKNGFDIYEWYDNVGGRVRWVKESGWYYLDAANTDGFTCTDSVYVIVHDETPLTVYTNPASREICIGDSIVVELSDGFEGYWWSTGHRGDRNVLYPEEDTRVVIEAIDSNGCETRVVFEIEVDSCTSAIKRIDRASQYKFYPNPASDFIRIDINNPALLNEWIEITDVNGKVILREQIRSLSTTIDVSEMPNTMFFIKIGFYYDRFQIKR